MVDHSKWRYYSKKEQRTDAESFAALFPGVAQKLKDDPVQVIDMTPQPKVRTAPENNTILVPKSKEDEQRSKSMFVERRRCAR
jgi:hypothetical protein